MPAAVTWRRCCCASVSPAFLERRGLGVRTNHFKGRRVVEGQRLIQAASDIFLGWNESESTGHDFYWRQLRDWKGSVDVDNVNVDDLKYLARLCGWTLARAHARSGDPVAIAGYLGSNDSFDEALVEFANSYADQNEKDYEAFMQQIRSRKLAATEG